MKCGGKKSADGLVVLCAGVYEVLAHGQLHILNVKFLTNCCL